MRRSLQAVPLVLCGLGLLHVSLVTDLYLRYVKEGMRPLLIATGAVLLLLGLASAVLDWRREDGHDAHEPHDGHDDHDGHEPHDSHEHHGGHEAHEGHDDHGGHDSHGGHGHDHSGPPRVAWLLLLPALSLLCYAPPALGAYTAARQSAKPVAHQGHFDPLPSASPLPMTLSDFTSRVREDRGQAIKGRVVRMTGFVTPGDGDGWELTRLILNCCAADAQSVKVRVHGGPVPPADTWVTVTGTWHPGGTLGTASAPVALDARTVTKVPRPTNGYQDALPPGESLTR